MSNQIHIFATKEDLMPNLKTIESQINTKYVLCEIYKKPNIPSLNSLLDYKNLGINLTGQHHSGDLFLVMHKDVSINYIKSKFLLAFAQYAVNQLAIPDSITFQPGGLYQNESKYLICGHIGTISDSKKSLELFHFFSTEIRKGFKKIKSYYVGKNALQLMKNGTRLITMGIDQSKEYDLRM